MKPVIDYTKKNPFSVIVLLGLLGTGGTAAKIGLFDQVMAPLHSIIYHQKINIHLHLGKTLHDSEDNAEAEMVKQGYWKPRGVVR